MQKELEVVRQELTDEDWDTLCSVHVETRDETIRGGINELFRKLRRANNRPLTGKKILEVCGKSPGYINDVLRRRSIPLRLKKTESEKVSDQWHKKWRIVVVRPQRENTRKLGNRTLIERLINQTSRSRRSLRFSTLKQEVLRRLNHHS